MRRVAILLLGCAVGACGGEPSGTDEAGATDVKLAQVRTRVSTAIAGAAELSLDKEYAGVVTPFRKAMVAAEVGGRVVERLVEPGDHVEKGDPLILIEQTRAQIARDRAQANLDARRVELRDAKRNLQRGERLAENESISDLELDTLALSVERAQAALEVARATLRDAAKNLEDTHVLAPFRGRVESVVAQVGDFLAPGRPVADLIDFSKARVRIGVTAGEAASLSPGAPVRIGFESIRQDAIQGRIKSVGRSAYEPGVFPVEIWIEGDAATRLRDGMVTSVALFAARRSSQIVIPTSALFRRGGATHVFKLDDNQRARLVAVTTGLASGGEVEIVSGISLGDEVIVDGQFALSEGALVEVVSGNGRR